ncbi:unnamed protein product, partial [Prorocentrum cordatum]
MLESQARENARLAEVRKLQQVADAEAGDPSGSECGSDDEGADDGDDKSFSANESDSDEDGMDAGKRPKASNYKSSTPPPKKFKTTKPDEKTAQHAKELHRPLSDQLKDFLNGKWAIIQARPPGQLLKDARAHVNSANKILKAKGASTVGAAINALAEIAETMTCVCSFEKGWSKFGSLDFAAAHRKYELLKTGLKQGKAPNYILKVASGKAVSIANSLGEQLDLIDESNTNGASMLP